jgi:hypothetical protein
MGMETDLMRTQNQLQAEAQNILDKMGLISFLEKYGQPIIVGSVAVGLMTWRDIDIEVVVNKVSIEDLLEIAKFLIQNPNIRNIQLQDNTGLRLNPQNPNGMYVGFKYKDEKDWKGDIWLLSENQHTGKDDIEWLNTNMTPERKEAILMIKSQIASHPEYRKNIFSMDIYKAVIGKNVTTYGEFLGYLETIGKKL